MIDDTSTGAGTAEVEGSGVGGYAEDHALVIGDDEGVQTGCSTGVVDDDGDRCSGAVDDAGRGIRSTARQLDISTRDFVADDADGVGQGEATGEVSDIVAHAQPADAIYVVEVVNQAGAGTCSAEVEGTVTGRYAEDHALVVGDDEGVEVSRETGVVDLDGDRSSGTVDDAGRGVRATGDELDVGGRDATPVDGDAIGQGETAVKVGDVIAHAQTDETVEVVEVVDDARAGAGAAEVEGAGVGRYAEDHALIIGDDEGVQTGRGSGVVDDDGHGSSGTVDDAGRGVRSSAGQLDVGARDFVAGNADGVGEGEAAVEVGDVLTHGETVDAVHVVEVVDQAGTGSGTAEVEGSGSGGDAEDHPLIVGDDEGVKVGGHTGVVDLDGDRSTGTVNDAGRGVRATGDELDVGGGNTTAGDADGVGEGEATIEVTDVLAHGQTADAVNVVEVVDDAGTGAGTAEVEGTVAGGHAEDHSLVIGDDEGIQAGRRTGVVDDDGDGSSGSADDTGRGIGSTAGQLDIGAGDGVAGGGYGVGEAEAAAQSTEVSAHVETRQAILVSEVPNEAGAGAGTAEVEGAVTGGDAEDVVLVVGDDEREEVSGGCPVGHDVDGGAGTIHDTEAGGDVPATVSEGEVAAVGLAESATGGTHAAVGYDGGAQVEAAGGTEETDVVPDVGPNQVAQVGDAPDGDGDVTEAAQVEGGAGGGDVQDVPVRAGDEVEALAADEAGAREGHGRVAVVEAALQRTAAIVKSQRAPVDGGAGLSGEEGGGQGEEYSQQQAGILGKA